MQVNPAGHRPQDTLLTLLPGVNCSTYSALLPGSSVKLQGELNALLVTYPVMSAVVTGVPARVYTIRVPASNLRTLPPQRSTQYTFKAVSTAM